MHIFLDPFRKLNPCSRPENAYPLSTKEKVLERVEILKRITGIIMLVLFGTTVVMVGFALKGVIEPKNAIYPFMGGTCACVISLGLHRYQIFYAAKNKVDRENYYARRSVAIPHGAYLNQIN